MCKSTVSGPNRCYWCSELTSHLRLSNRVILIKQKSYFLMIEVLWWLETLSIAKQTLFGGRTFYRWTEFFWRISSTWFWTRESAAKFLENFPVTFSRKHFHTEKRDKQLGKIQSHCNMTVIDCHFHGNRIPIMASLLVIITEFLPTVALRIELCQSLVQSNIGRVILGERLW